MNVGYALREIRKHGTDRQWWRKRFLTHVVGRYFTTIGRPEATPLLERDWDVAVLLDACRYDLFEETVADHPLDGTLEKRRSVQSATPGYLRENVGDDDHHDLVYVTANPYVATMFDEDQFHAVDNVWRDGWDDDLQTVPPETMADRAIDALEAYPNKRVLVHFNQPHAPFVGEKRLGGRNYSAIREEALGGDRPDPEERRPTPFERLARGEVTKDEVWEAYRSNLERALPPVERILEATDGRTVVTSDHGNALGEWATPFPIRVYGHPLNVFIPALVDVPYHVHETGARREVIAEPPTETADDDDDVDDETKERLRMLGYAE